MADLTPINPTLSNRAYDVLKYIALVLLPALGALYFGLGQIWNFPAVEQVVGSITVLDAFLGIILSKGSNTYQNNVSNASASVGNLIVSQDRLGQVSGLSFEATRDPFVLPADQKVVFDVKRKWKLDDE